MMRVPTALVGCEVRRTAFDSQVRLTLVGPDPAGDSRVEAELVIETRLRLRAAGGDWHTLDPGSGSAVAPVIDLFMQTVASVEVHGDGALTLGFTNGAALVVHPDRQYESWHLTGVGVPQILVGPGGETGWVR